MDKQINRFSVPCGPFIDLSSEFWSYGKYEIPRLVLLVGVHGDETETGAAIAHKLFKKLEQRSSDLKGTVTAIIGANPLATMEKARVSSIDAKDLNRVGLGNRYGSFTERIAYKLYREVVLENCNRKPDIVLDLHNFEMQTRPMAILCKQNNSELEQRLRKLIQVLDLPITWIVDSEIRDRSYESTFSSALLQEGITAIPIEVTQEKYLKKQDSDLVVEGIIRLMNYLGFFNSDTLMSLDLSDHLKNGYCRHEYTAKYSGKWIPNSKISLEQYVNPETVIGNLGCDGEAIYSHKSGVLLQYREGQNYVDIGTSLFSIGIEDI